MTAKSRHLDNISSKVHVHQAETPTNKTAVAKQPAYIFRQRIGCGTYGGMGRWTDYCVNILLIREVLLLTPTLA